MLHQNVCNVNHRLDQESQTSLKTSLANVDFVEDEDENYEIRSICNFSRGFAFGFMNGNPATF